MSEENRERQQRTAAMQQNRGPMGGGGWGAMGRPVEKAKNFKGTALRLLGYFRSQKIPLMIVLVAAILGTTFNIVGPKILGLATTKLFDGLIAKYQAFQRHQPAPGIDFKYIATVLLILLGLYIISAIFMYVQQYVMAGVAQRMVYRLRREVEEKLSRLPLKFFDSRPRGEILSRAVNDMDNISTTLQQSLTQLITSVVGGIMVTNGSIAIGDVQAFIQYAQQFTQPITSLANIANVIQSTMASAERIFELLDEPEEIPEAVDAQVIGTPQGAVQFQHVKFGYKEDSMLMEDMNIDVQPGQMIAVVGPTGAGKTTLVNLLMRFYEVNGGKITVDGVDITQFKRGELRRTFGMVLQDTWLFNGTIRDNIAYGREGATEEEIMRAAKAANADHFIRTLPEGYNTVLNEEATNISQGQKQLLTIARAFLADPEILILDEATSSVDTRTEIQIQKAMGELMHGRTSFVIAHRLSTIRDADLILVMNHGSIIEKGTHEELLAKGGFYADLYNSQFTGRTLLEEAV